MGVPIRFLKLLMQLQGHRFPCRFSASVPLIVQSSEGGNKFSFSHWPDGGRSGTGQRCRRVNCYDQIVAMKHIGSQAGKFVKHVLPAAVKPVHSLWHEVLGFIFLAVAGVASFNVAHHFSSMTPGKLALIIPLIVITASYGVSSFLKARRISRS
jgi:hypothetical protein